VGCQKRHFVGIITMRFILALSFALSAALALCGTALADDWLVVKLRGGVQQMIDNAWVDLERGDSIPDDRLVRTLGDGHVDLKRGEAVVSLGASSQAQIHDEADTGFTSVQQDFGSVEVEADVRNVPHFSVETKYLAAVVKGTHFIVTSDDTGGSVTVTRGFVAVESKATKRSTTVTVGQTASVSPATDIVLSGSGLLPAIYESDGTVFQAAHPAPDGGGAVPVSTEGLRLGPAGAAAPGLDGSTPGKPDADVRQTAMLGQVGLNIIVNHGEAPAIKEQPVSPTTVWIGVIIGAMMGGVALLFRRYWR
jgi:hypothetical protein